ncbi:cyanase [Pseudogracilibacillus sp. SO30301A]|uniref:cyanase n=1 Tax=Pseudogracilibacillus sp. SO30301A TaxID=3098291 RepID=UPI00300DDB24
MKSIIHEKFDDGIMSTIDFIMDIDRREHPDGDCLVITMDGKIFTNKEVVKRKSHSKYLHEWLFTYFYRYKRLIDPQYF